MAEGKPIFYDQQRRRWKRTSRVLEISGAIFTFLVIIFFVNAVKPADLPELLLPATRYGHALPSKRTTKPALRPGRRRMVAALGTVPPNSEKPLRVAFYVPWDSNSFASLQQHYKEIDVLVPEALHAVSPDGRLDVEPDPKLSNWLKALEQQAQAQRSSSGEFPVMSLVNNYDGKEWRIPEMAQMLAHPESRQRLATALANFATTQKEPGIVLDFEEVPESSQPDFKRFVHELGAALHAANLKLLLFF